MCVCECECVEELHNKWMENYLMVSIVIVGNGDSTVKLKLFECHCLRRYNT